jgi:hypothetical protein
MTNEHAEYISRCEGAFNTFIAATPAFVNNEGNCRALIASLDRLSLSYDRASHLEIAFRQIQSRKAAPTAAAPVTPQPESFDASVEKEANRILDSGELTAESLFRMTAKQVENAQRNFAWVRALEILEARRVKQTLAPADVALAERRALTNGTSTQMEISRAEQQMASVATHNLRPAVSSPTQRSAGILNTHQMATYSTRRKKTPEAIIAADKRDQKWISEQEELGWRRRRIAANKQK